MAEIEDLHRVIAETIYNVDPFAKDEAKQPFGPDEHGVLRGKSLIAHMQARAVLERLGLLDGVSETETGREYGTKFPQRFEDNHVPHDTMTSRKEVLGNVKRVPGAIAVERRVAHIRGPWRSIEE